MTKEEKKYLIELLEKIHPFINNGCSYEKGKLQMIEFAELKNEVYDFVKLINPKTRLKKIKIKCNPNITMAC